MIVHGSITRGDPERQQQGVSMKKSLVFVAAALMVLGAGTGIAGDGDLILGLWLTAPSDDGRAHVEVTKVDSKYEGKIVWLEQPVYPADDEEGMGGKEKVDRENPDPKLRTRPIIGLKMVKGFTYAGDDLWSGGTIYDPENGKTYKCKMRLTEEGVLKVRGYIGFSLIGRTTVWTRVEEEG